MQNIDTRKRIWNYAQLAIIALLCAATLLLDFIEISFIEDTVRNRFISKIVQQGLGAAAAIMVMCRLKLQLFGKPQYLLYMIPCLIIAIDNFQFSSYFNGNMRLVHNEAMDFILFGGYCLAVGLFEECIFRGIIFSVLVTCFPQDKKGLWKSYVISSIFFGAAHLFNGFSMATILQIAYSTLTGGLFAFVLLKTKNIFCCAFVHATYNFCGLLFDVPERMGLGAGIVFDLGTVITMSVVSITVGAFILYSVFKYSEEERRCLYTKLGVPMKEKAEEVIESADDSIATDTLESQEETTNTIE